MSQQSSTPSSSSSGASTPSSIPETPPELQAQNAPYLVTIKVPAVVINDQLPKVADFLETSLNCRGVKPFGENGLIYTLYPSLDILFNLPYTKATRIIKTYEFQRLNAGEVVDNFRTEVGVYKRLPTEPLPGFVKYVSAFELWYNTTSAQHQIREPVLDPAQDRTHLLDTGFQRHFGAIIMKKCTDNLADWIEPNYGKLLPETVALQIFGALGRALNYLHAKLNIVHGDIVARNIGVWMQSDNAVPEYMWLDFAKALTRTPKEWQAAEEQSKLVCPPDSLELIPSEEADAQKAKPANEFLREAANFARLLLRLTWADPWASERNPSMFKRVLLRMAIANGEQQISISRGLALMRELQLKD